MLCTVVVNLQLHILTPGVTLRGDYAYYLNPENKIIIYDLGTVQYEQVRNIILESESHEIKYFFTYKIGGASYSSEEYYINIPELQEDKINTNEVNAHTLRYELVENIRTMINYNNCRDYENSKILIKKIESKLRKEVSTNTSLIMGMIENLVGTVSEGQITLAITNQNYFKRWGELYLDQLTRSLNQQIKPNFKDAACIFGGNQFDIIVDKTSDIFDSLPPPVPSNLNQVSHYNSSQYRNLNSTGSTHPLTSLSAYNNISGGCYTGDSLITMNNGMQKRVNEIKKGDKVLTFNNSFNLLRQRYENSCEATVICVVKTVYNKGINLVHLNGGLKITSWHPIYMGNKWIFPIMAQKPIATEVREAYTLLLDKYHIVIVNDVSCICLGHNFKTDSILNHPYFGTDNIINDLKKLDNWDNGKVTIESSKYTRDNTKDNLINGLNI